MNIGHSSKLIYDDQAYKDRLIESVSPLGYQLNPYRTTNCNSCLSTLGPRASLYGEGVSTTIPEGSTRRIAPVNELVDIDSILSNRNVKHSKTKSGEVNNIDVTKFKLSHVDQCDKFLDSISSRLSYPSSNYRSIGVNRFYDLPKNPQSVIFWDFAVNTRLEAKDNYKAEIPKVKLFDPSLPTEFKCNNNKTNL